MKNSNIKNRSEHAHFNRKLKRVTAAIFGVVGILYLSDPYATYSIKNGSSYAQAAGTESAAEEMLTAASAAVDGSKSADTAIEISDVAQQTVENSADSQQAADVSPEAQIIGSGYTDSMIEDKVEYDAKSRLAKMSDVKYIFVGDSRTVGLEKAIGESGYRWICKVGEGYKYFLSHVDEVADMGGYGTKIIINFGVNDLHHADEYIELVNSYIDEWSSLGMTVYYSSVTPVDGCKTVSNAQIEAFNDKLQAGLDSRVNWIDSYDYMTTNGFTSPDGLHYNTSTYKNLYSFYLAETA